MYAALPDYANAEVLHQHQRYQQQPQQPLPQQQQQPQSQLATGKSATGRGSASSSASGSSRNGGCGGSELDERAGRFASALLLLAALVLAVDAMRMGMYSWYTEGAHLRFTYGGAQSVVWPKCAAAVPPPIATLPQPHEPPPPPEPLLQVPPQPLGQTADGAAGETWLAGATRSAMTGVLLAGEALNAGFLRPRPRPPPKPLAVALGHAGPAACLCLLLTAALPACLHSARPSRCALAAAVGFAVASVALAALAVAACIVKIYLFTLCEISPTRSTPQFNYDNLVPPCPLLRKAFFCAECFSLLVMIAAACMAVCLLAFFSRALCCRGGVRRRQTGRRPPRRYYGDGARYGCGSDDYGGDSFPV